MSSHDNLSGAAHLYPYLVGMEDKIPPDSLGERGSFHTAAILLRVHDTAEQSRAPRNSCDRRDRDGWRERALSQKGGRPMAVLGVKGVRRNGGAGGGRDPDSSGRYARTHVQERKEARGWGENGKRTRVVNTHVRTHSRTYARPAGANGVDCALSPLSFAEWRHAVNTRYSATLLGSSL